MCFLCIISVYWVTLSLPPRVVTIRRKFLSVFTSAMKVMFLPWFVCRFLCLSVSRITQKVMDEFLPFDAMHSADYAVARCPSVRLSVCHKPVETAKRIVTLFSPSCSHTILVFLP